jgi:hypothetical protein
MKKQKITISRHSDSVGGFSSKCSGGFHHLYICIPNDSVRIRNDGDAITIIARWDKTRFQMPELDIKK